MKKMLSVIVLVFVLVLSSCGGDDVLLYNFKPRQDNTLFSTNGEIIIDYKTDTNGELIELNIDHLLSIEEMIMLNPIIDFDIEIEGFTGNIFMQPRSVCTQYSNDLLIPINIEVGNTRYKFDNLSCLYKTVDTNNQFREGFADEYHLMGTITEDKNTTISIIIYNPEELVRFIEIYELPHTRELLGTYSMIVTEERDEVIGGYHNYYKDMGIYEQLYLKHQDNTPTKNEINGIPDDINIMDLQNLTEVIPLIADFETLYADEIAAIDELQDEIGTNFSSDESTEETE